MTDYSIIYKNENVYIVHFDNLSSKYDKEVYGTLIVTENKKTMGYNTVVERIITWKPIESKNENIPVGVRIIKIDIENLKSIKRAKMTMGNCYSYMVFYEREGNHHPMLVFPDGGTKTLMEKLENFCSINKSTTDMSLYLVESKKDVNYFDTVENLTSLLNDMPNSAAAKANKPQASSQLWSSFINLGANISNQFQRTPGLSDTKIRNLLREDALGIECNGVKMETKQEPDLGFMVVSKCPSGDFKTATVSTLDRFVPLDSSGGRPDVIFCLAKLTAKWEITQKELLHPLFIFLPANFQAVRINLPPASPIQRQEPLHEHEWKKYLAPDGSVTCKEKLLEKIFKGGIDPPLRKIVWKYLLGYYSWDLSLEENLEAVKAKEILCRKLEIQWQNVFPEQEERFSAFQDRRSIIDRDVHRTDRALDYYSDEEGKLTLIRKILLSYSIYNFNLGYVQGMNDLLAPILYVMDDEVDAFWCFSKYMDRMEANFHFDQNGIKRQFRQLYVLLQLFDPEFAEYLEHKGCNDMLFCFRFMLVNFKRELSYECTMYLWEVLWTDYRCKKFQLLFTLAVILHQRNHIMENRYGLNEILKHFNDLVLNNDLHQLLCRAESLYLQLEQIWPQVPLDMRQLLDFHESVAPSNGAVTVDDGGRGHYSSSTNISSASSTSGARH